MKRQFIAVALCIPFLLAAPSAAKMYKWRDANGVLHFSQEPPPGQAVEEYHEVTRPESAYKKPPAVSTYPKQGAAPSGRPEPAPASRAPEYPAADAAYEKLTYLAETVNAGVTLKNYRPLVREASIYVNRVQDRDRRSALAKIFRLYETAETCWYNSIRYSYKKFSKTGRIKYTLFSAYSIITDSWDGCRQKCWRKSFEMLREYRGRFD